jgi:hypothetical protein
MAYSTGGRRVHLLKRLRMFAVTTAAFATGAFRFAMDARDENVELTPGDTAPDFALVGSDGRTYRLNDLAGRPVVLAWFPKAFTGG